MAVVRVRGLAARFPALRGVAARSYHFVVNDVGGYGCSVGAAPPRRGACSQQSARFVGLRKEAEGEGEGEARDFASLVSGGTSPSLVSGGTSLRSSLVSEPRARS